MKQHFKSITLLLICFSFPLASCNKDWKKEENNIPTLFDMYGKYVLVDIQANFPIDINFDGIENIDLTKEIDVFNDCFIYLTDENITIAWPESQVYQYPLLTSEIPTDYTGQEDINYLLVSRYYTYSIGYWNGAYARVYPVEIKENEAKNYYGFISPTMIVVDKEQNTITFDYACQNFMTKEGIKARQFSAVFKPDTDKK
jgi:hypothetical protein